MKRSFNPVRGMFDYAPKEALVRENVRSVILNCYQNNGYNLIETPIVESLDFLESSDGGDNLKLIYKILKRGDKLDLTKENLSVEDISEEGLRYDLTVPLARFYAGNREKLPTPFKSIQIGNSFRAERPQKGRNRQFVQCDIDVFGDKTIFAELDLLSTSLEALEKLGFKNLSVKINDRRILNGIIIFAGFNEQDISTICVTLDKLDKIGITGVIMELCEKGFEAEKINRLTEIVNDILARGTSCLTQYGVEEEIVKNVEFLIENLNKTTINKQKIYFDITIVRGQGYYTGTVFEIFAEDFGRAMAGGGRYDKMLTKFAGLDVPAVGFSLGYEPICMLIQERDENTEGKNLALIFGKDDDINEVYKIKNQLKSKYNVSLFLEPKNMKTFYEKIVAVADFATSVRDFKENKPIKIMNNEK